MTSALAVLKTVSAGSSESIHADERSTSSDFLETEDGHCLNEFGPASSVLNNLLPDCLVLTLRSFGPLSGASSRFHALLPKYNSSRNTAASETKIIGDC